MRYFNTTTLIVWAVRGVVRLIVREGDTGKVSALPPPPSSPAAHPFLKVCKITPAIFPKTPAKGLRIEKEAISAAVDMNVIDDCRADPCERGSVAAG